ncbi:hypothetical protein AZ54_22510 [Xanthomonas oryzae pv. oryzae PXO86]|uniref:Multi-sensor hybrid histidine kinase n=1 Tax=Xanthomonas oryzae pv. oryzae (strain PXO99A) TaxID=360094 RepID=A0A0K0GQR6_XANOP|nr:multi-sensor hybrid histidine kinase [Xanthomonas oryzae pv. oryzae PXO99A]AJQ85674.1 hypothetical protein AZ54_22510 [Xanthomonas oryzae pv. oryzae PXO86]
MRATARAAVAKVPPDRNVAGEVLAPCGNMLARYDGNTCLGLPHCA